MTYIRRVNIKEPPPYLRPVRVALDPDDYHARFVGWTKDRHQVFVANVFVPEAVDRSTREFLARFIFDKSGNLVDLTLEPFGPRDTVAADAMTARMEELFAEFGPIKRKRIEMNPFKLTFKGIEFGLILVPPEDGSEEPTLELHPGNTMSFHVPWNSGLYDT